MDKRVRVERRLIRRWIRLLLRMRRILPNLQDGLHLSSRLNHQQGL